MKTTMYLLRPAAADGSDPRANPPLSRLGVRQAEATRNFLAIRPVDCCYCSPQLRAYQTTDLTWRRTAEQRVRSGRTSGARTSRGA